MGKDRFQWFDSVPHTYENWKPPKEIEDSAFARRRLFFERHAGHCNGHAACPACGYPTLCYRNHYDYCSLCHWEDDGQDDPWADQRASLNGESLAQARRNFESTYCMFPAEEAERVHPETWQRLYSDEARIQKQRLCELFDGLSNLTTDEEIAHQWRLIDAQWFLVP